MRDPAGNELCLCVDNDTAPPRRRLMQVHEFTFVLPAPPEDVWELFWYRGPDRPQPNDGVTRIEILHPGDEVGEGLVRHCTFKVPRILGSGGVGQSWEWLTQVKPYESWRYDAVGKPLWSRATGFTRLENLGDGTTRVHFKETYEAFNPWMRRLGLERWVHRKISRDNDELLAAMKGGLQWHERRRARAQTSAASSETAESAAVGESDG